MAPPPMQTPGPCDFISGAAATKASCAPCPWDTAIPPTHLCAFVDANGNGIIDAGDQAPSLFVPLPPLLRGFDDPQADGDSTYVKLATIRVKYTRGDLYSLPFADGNHKYDTRNNGNPTWGSCIAPTDTGNKFNCSIIPDADADQIVDNPIQPDRHNHGMYAALYDWGPEFAARPIQQYPFDAFAGKSCPKDLSSCDPYAVGNDCGGFAHFAAFTSNNGTPYAGAAPQGLGGPGGSPYQIDEPPFKDKWPVVPFGRDWPPYDSGASADYPSTGPSPNEAIRRLLRFVSSIVTYDSSAPVTSAYTLAEPSTEVVATAPGTPLAGALEDAYQYFQKSVFAPSPVPDPAIDCRNYIIVYITDGQDECNSEACGGGRSGNPYPGGGVAYDLAHLALPESAPGARHSAHLIDNSVRELGIPVNIVAMANADSPFYPAITCIAGADPEGKVFLASNRDALEAALETILDFKKSAKSFVAPAVPAFAGSGSDTAMIGAVIPSHQLPNDVLASWSIWNGSLKALKLDNRGLLPVVTAAAATVTPTVGAGTPTPPPTRPRRRRRTRFRDEVVPTSPASWFESHSGMRRVCSAIRDRTPTSARTRQPPIPRSRAGRTRGPSRFGRGGR